jgi:hypothetical protein
MVDVREDFDSYDEAIRTAIDGKVATIQTGMPGIIISFNGVTATVQPATKVAIQDDKGNITYKTIAPISEVPVQFPSGGGFTHTFPIAPGDECWLSFGSRCIDGWWASGGIQPPLHPRQHDISDPVAHLGFRSKPRALANVSLTTHQIRSDDGATYIEMAGGGIVNVVAPTAINLNAPNVNVSGNLVAIGQVVAKSGTTNIHLSTHTHASDGASPTPNT